MGGMEEKRYEEKVKHEVKTDDSDNVTEEKVERKVKKDD